MKGKTLYLTLAHGEMGRSLGRGRSLGQPECYTIPGL